ncbi:hypothetical protein [Dysgonomonas massiliensis]|uniref:hypothetical protein n=1 Tax=Dysgonomonas massiliensis TaxID=2040292 RepID=UPI000C783B36|nr:hypothetical protein [Dysgonomonas massiliensis]
MGNNLMKYILRISKNGDFRNIDWNILDRLITQGLKREPRFVFSSLSFISMLVSAKMCWVSHENGEISNLDYFLLVLYYFFFLGSVALFVYSRTNRFKLGALGIKLGYFFDDAILKIINKITPNTIFIKCNSNDRNSLSEVDFRKFILIKFRNDIDIDQVCVILLKESKIAQEDICKLRYFFQGITPFSKIKITSRASRNNVITYRWLFDLLNEYIEGGILTTLGSRREQLLLLIHNNFMKGEEPFIHKNLESRYCDWRKPILKAN